MRTRVLVNLMPYKEAIKALQAQGYRVVVANPDGSSFDELYAVYQGKSDKVVICNRDGRIVGLQG